ncbi:MAG: amidohydrolase [Kaiparowitsia implicata GSE-PSE-MK54-09C]|nr:amidohydrolase [Kaiparowitsia implicata GSE-PSE-MK54-09C]
MNAVGTEIRGALLPQGESDTAVNVQIEGGAIAAVDASTGQETSPASGSGSVVSGTNKLLLPGFVNAHTHSSEMWQRGLIPMLPLELWLADLYDTSPMEPEMIYLSALGTAVETLLSGGTTVVDHLAMIPGKELESVEAAVRAYRDVGIRAFVGPLIQDSNLPDSVPSGGIPRETQPYPMSTDATLDFMKTVIDKFHAPEDGIFIMMAPTGAQLCSDALLEGCVALSDRHSLCRHTHLLETKVQQMHAYEKYGHSAVEHLHQLGFLGDRTSLAHCVWLTEADTQILATTGSTAVHNPLSNLRLGSGIAPILKYRQAGINVAFGCDGAASNDSQDVLEVLKIGSILHNTTTFEYRDWISPRAAVQMAAQGGATGLGLGDRLGKVAPGYSADLVLYDLTSLSLLPRTDPVGLLVLGRPTQVVDAVWVAGKPVVVDGNVTTVDVEGLTQALLERQQKFPSLTTRAEMEPHYRHIMTLAD